MSYSFRDDDRTVEEGVQRIAASQIDKGLGELASSDLDVAEKIHQVRKRCKKLRGLVRLVRPAFEGYATENAIFRDLARELSDLRDDDAILEALDRIEADVGVEALDGIFRDLRSCFIEARRRARETDDVDAKLDKAGLAFASARRRIAGWKLDAAGAEAVAGGLTKTYKRAVGAHETASGDPRDATLHEWRKRVKYHWYHARLLKRIAPDFLKPHIAAAYRLADMLGDRQDLAVMRAKLDDLGDGFDLRSREALRAVLLNRQEALERRAFVDGRRLLADRPKALKRRWRQWWVVWRETA